VKFVQKNLCARNHTQIIIYGTPGVNFKIVIVLDQNITVDFILESPHKCLVCGKTYTRKIILEKHQKTHSSEPNEPKLPKIIKAAFSCDDCPKRFTRKEYLKAHISIHTKGKVQLE